VSKICTRCHLEKDASEFYIRGDKSGLRAVCVLCTHPPKLHSCELCGVEWQSIGGSGKRSVSRCEKCYPIYRRAYGLFLAARHRAKVSLRPFELTVEYIEKKLKEGCQRTGTPFNLTLKSGGTNFTNRDIFSPSLDKIDPDGGYTIENTQFVIWIYNMAKQRWSDKDVLNFCQKVVEFDNKTQSAVPGMRFQ